MQQHYRYVYRGMSVLTSERLRSPTSRPKNYPSGNGRSATSVDRFVRPHSSLLNVPEHIPPLTRNITTIVSGIWNDHKSRALQSGQWTSTIVNRFRACMNAIICSKRPRFGLLPITLTHLCFDRMSVHHESISPVRASRSTETKVSQPSKTISGVMAYEHTAIQRVGCFDARP